MNFSAYQQEIFKFAELGQGHGCVEAVAGSGKSTTAVNMVERFSRVEQGLFSSFTRIIVEDLQKKLKDKGISNVESLTYNSLGNRAIRQYMRPAPRLLIKPGEKTDNILKFDIFGGILKDSPYWKVKNSIIRLVSLFKNLAITEVLEADRRFDEIVDTYDVIIPSLDNYKQMCLDTFRLSIEKTNVIDFDDQKFFPILFGWPLTQVDFLVLDEYQDSSPLERELMLRTCHGGRVIVFGDRNQAIYGFKGTTADNMQRFVEMKSATRLPLSICYRCPKAVVREAQKIVPEIEWAPNAIEGSVDTIKTEEAFKRATVNDMFLARVTEDLVLSVNDFLMDGRPAYIEGREYGTQLLYFIEKINKDDNDDLELFDSALDHYFEEQHAKLMKLNRENLALQLESRTNTVKALMLSCKSVSGLVKKIDEIFKDKGKGIRHMTIHKSKGLESEKNGDVFILRPDKIPHPRSRNQEEEMRLKYVGITRARRNLFYVTRR